MKQKSLIMLGVAVGCGLVAAIAVAKLTAGGSKAPDGVKVLVAKKDIPIDTTLDEKSMDEFLAWSEIPKHLVPPDPVEDLAMIKGKSNNRTLKAGDRVALSDIGKANKIVIPDGLKQITFPVSAADGVEGFAKPGSKVDVMYIESLPSGRARAAIIMRSMLVLALNKVDRLDEKTGTAIAQVESVSLAVNDKQATTIALAERKGKLKLVLRGSAGLTTEESSDDSIKWIDDPFDSGSPAPAPAPAAAPVEKWEAVVIAKKPVPVNTLLNTDNVNDFFSTQEVKKAPAGAVTSVDDLKGKFVVKAITEGQQVFKTLTADKAIEIEKPLPPEPKVVEAPAPKVVEAPKPKLPRFEQTVTEAGLAKKVIWVEISPGKFKRFDDEKAADAYRPDAEKTESSKSEEGKPSVEKTDN